MIKLDIPKIIQLYVDEKQSTIEIAKLFETSHTTINRHLKQNGIVLRNKKEALEKHSVKATCVICGKIFRPRLHWTDTNKSNRKTCSNKCFKDQMKIVQSGNLNSYWRGGHSQSHYERIRKELKEQVCEHCGSTTERLDTHHIDRNKSNNSPENIMVLCGKCHAKLHYKEDNRGMRGWKG